MNFEEEGFSRGGGHHFHDDLYDNVEDVGSQGHLGGERHCHHCGCHPQNKRRGCRCRCHSNYHNHDRRERYCDCRHEHEPDRWCHCGCHDNRKVHHVCRELARILRDQKRPQHDDCGCTASIQQLKRSRVSRIIPFMLFTRNGRLFVEWGRQRHHSYATVFFSVVRVNCRYNEAILELLKPNKPITNPHTGKIERRRIREVDYVVPTGERIFVDLNPMREVRRLPQDFVKRYR